MADTEIGGSDRSPCCADLSTKELIKVVNTQEAETPSFVLNAFFTNVVRTDADKVEIQSKNTKTDKALAPFVCPCVEGKPNEAMGGWNSVYITPAYIKQTDALNACHKDLATKGFGEDCQIRFTRRQRRDAHVADILGRQVGRIMRREEWMGVSSLLNGGYIVSGDRYPAQMVKMPRWDDAETTECADKCGNSSLDARIYELCNKEDLWNNECVDIPSHVEDIVAFIFENAGASVTDVIVGTDVAKAVRKNKMMRELVKCSAEIASAQLGGTDFQFGFQRPVRDQNSRYLGTMLAGSGINFWTYTGTYEDVVTHDDAGDELPRDQWYKVVKPFIPKDVAVFIDNSDTDTGLSGTRYYGAIMDLDWDFATDGPQARFVKRWSQPDPSCWFIQTQSAPLVLPCNANASLAICLVESADGGLCLKNKDCPVVDAGVKIGLKGYTVSEKITDVSTGKVMKPADAEKRKSVSADKYQAAQGDMPSVQGVR